MSQQGTDHLFPAIDEVAGSLEAYMTTSYRVSIDEIRHRCENSRSPSSLQQRGKNLKGRHSVKEVELSDAVHVVCTSYQSFVALTYIELQVL